MLPRAVIGRDTRPETSARYITTNSVRAIIGWPPPRDDQAMAQALPTAFRFQPRECRRSGRSARQWQVVGPGARAEQWPQQGFAPIQMRARMRLPWDFESRYVYVTYITRNYVTLRYVTPGGGRLRVTQQLCATPTAP